MVAALSRETLTSERLHQLPPRKAAVRWKDLPSYCRPEWDIASRKRKRQDADYIMSEEEAAEEEREKNEEEEEEESCIDEDDSDYTGDEEDGEDEDEDEDDSSSSMDEEETELRMELESRVAFKRLRHQSHFSTILACLSQRSRCIHPTQNRAIR